jgi:rhamnosyl/mannosyltransferase
MNAVRKVLRANAGRGGMRVLHLGKYYPPVSGGIETITWDLVEGFNRRGIVCDVVVAGAEPRRIVDAYSTPNRSYRVIRAACKLTVASTPISPDYVRAFAENCAGYDVVILHMPNPLACLALLMSGFTGKVGLIWHSDVIKQKILLTAFRPLQTWTIRRANFVIGATPAHLHESECARLFEGKGHLVPFGLNEGRMGAAGAQAAAPDPVAFPERISILAVGRLVYYKGFDVLFEAMAQLGPQYQLVIVGDGPLRQMLERKAVVLGVAERVRLVGNVSPQELRRHFEECDVFCLPSIERAEMYGMVQLEAMAFGKPLVVTAIPRSGVRFVVRDGVTGMTVTPGDPSALATALHALGQNPELRRRYGRAGRQVFEEEYTVDKMVDRHIEVYARAMDGSDRPGAQ